MSASAEVHVVVPDMFDDPVRPSGGNVYDRRICHGLAALGWSVRVLAVAGSWPSPDPAACARLAAAIAAIPDGGLVLVDGLIASAVPDVLVPEAARLRLVALVHLPLGAGQPGEDGAAARVKEHAVLSAATAIVATSDWTRCLLLDRYALPGTEVHVAEPGVDAAEIAPGTASGGELLCVAAVAPHKGHDVLFDALAAIADLPWRCVCVGAVDRDPRFVDQLVGQAAAHGIDDRVRLTGPRAGAGLDDTYAAADVLVSASHAETYGMVVTEALARGLPVVATAVGGLPDALGGGADGSRPGLLVPPRDSGALAAALRRWLSDEGLRRQLRRAARERRATLADWSVTSARISRVLAEAGR